MSDLIINRTAVQQSTGQLATGLQQLGFMLFGFSIITTNIVSILVLTKCRKMAFQLRSLAINLAVTDLTCGLTMIVYYTAALNILTCRMLLFVMCSSVVVSMVTITSFALDHALALQFSTKYLLFISPTRINIYCFLTWCVGFLVTWANFIDSFKQYYKCNYSLTVGNTGQTISNFIVLAFYLANFLMYMYVLMIVRQRSKWLTVISNQTRCLVLKQQIRTMTKLFVITGTYFIMTTPNIVFNFINVYGTINSLHIYAYISSLMILCNSIVNPFLFVYRFKECRFIFLRIFFFWNKAMRDRYMDKLSLVITDYTPSTQQRSQQVQQARIVTVQSRFRNTVHPTVIPKEQQPDLSE